MITTYAPRGEGGVTTAGEAYVNLTLAPHDATLIRDVLMATARTQATDRDEILLHQAAVALDQGRFQERAARREREAAHRADQQRQGAAAQYARYIAGIAERDALGLSRTASEEEAMRAETERRVRRAAHLRELRSARTRDAVRKDEGLPPVRAIAPYHPICAGCGTSHDPRDLCPPSTHGRGCMRCYGCDRYGVCVNDAPGHGHDDGTTRFQGGRL